MNNLTLFDCPENNIYEERFRQMDLCTDMVKNIMEANGYAVSEELKEVMIDPINKQESVLMEGVDKDDPSKSARVFIPDLKGQVSFLVNNNKWIPVFQVCDLPYFQKNEESGVVIYNAHTTLTLNQSMDMFWCGVKDITYPSIYLLFEVERNISTILKRLNIEFEESDHLEEDEDRIYFKICKNKYYLINETSKNNKLLRCFYDMSKDRLSKVFEIFDNYDTEEEGCQNLLLNWCDSDKIKNLVSMVKVKDFMSVPNGVLNGPSSIIDVFYYILENNISVDSRAINDLSKRRVRLAEWLVYRLHQQYKYNIIQDKRDVFDKAIFETLLRDSRRELDNTVNPLSELSIMSKIIFNGTGGITKESSSPSIRNIHPSYYGVIDFMDTPPGASVGITQQIPPECYLVNGILHNPFVNVEDLSV